MNEAQKLEDNCGKNRSQFGREHDMRQARGQPGIAAGHEREQNKRFCDVGHIVNPMSSEKLNRIISNHVIVLLVIAFIVFVIAVKCYFGVLQDSYPGAYNTS